MHKRIIGSTIIMVLTISQVLFSFPFNLPEIKEAHAATRLGLHVTQEELNIWRQRRNDNVNGINGYSYQQIYQNRILSDANAFKSQSHPGGDGYWVGYTANDCAHGFNNTMPARDMGRQLMASAFHFMLTGDTSYAAPVAQELLNQITVSGTNFTNTSKWCYYDGTTNHVYAIDSSEVWPWQQRYLHAYEYLLIGGYNGFTAQNKADIVTWFHAGGLLWSSVLDTIPRMAYPGFFDTPQDLTCTSCSGNVRGLTNYGGNVT